MTLEGVTLPLASLTRLICSEVRAVFISLDSRNGGVTQAWLYRIQRSL